MKTFKEIKKTILESGEHTLGGGFGDTFVKTNPFSAIKDYGKANYDLGEDDNLKRVNAFLKAYFNRPMDDPAAHLGQLRTKLNIIGLDFKCGRNEKMKEGINSYVLTRFGGITGKSPTTPFDEFDNEDGFGPGSSYNLVLNVGTDESGLYNVNAQVVGQADESNGASEA
jgi:hypothetical protein